MEDFETKKRKKGAKRSRKRGAPKYEQGPNRTEKLFAGHVK